MTISVLGGGAFGTSLAIAFSASQDVTLWARSACSLKSSRVSPKLPHALIPENVRVTSNLSDVADEAILLAIPMQQLRDFLRQHGATFEGRYLIACCKGIDFETGLGPIEILETYCPKSIAGLLSGPSFAADIAKGKPTALTLAARSDATVAALQKSVKAANVRFYGSADTMGVQMGGALKNVIAIGAGAVMAAGLGESARSALITRGFAEMTRLACAKGAHLKTLTGLSGMGDLVLTCTSEQSRNFRYGKTLSSHDSEIENETVEGIATGRAVLKMSGELGVETPICQAIVDVMDRKVSIKSALEDLLARPVRYE